MTPKMTRRRFLLGAGVVAGGAAATSAGALITSALSPRRPSVASLTANAASGTTSTTAASAAPAAPTIPPYSGLRTRPDLDGAAGLKVRTSTGAAAPGYLLITPKTTANVQGAAVYDNAGHLAWFHPLGPDAGMVHNLQTVQYQGQTMLAWYEGKAPSGSPGFGDGAYLLYNTSYEQVATIRGENGTPIDLHELVVTPQGTALVAAYLPVTRDLTWLGGAKNTTVYDWHLQEIDIATGKLLFSWHAIDHVHISETTEAPPTDPGGAFDYFHGNSIDLMPDGKHYLVSSRNTSTLFKIERATGDIVWRLRGADKGSAPGKHLKLLPDGESFWYQHDARSHADGTISVFDDGGQPYHHDGRGLLMDIDEAAGTATIRRDDSINIHVNFEGSFRPQANGDWVAGWGDVGGLTEFGPNGDVVLDIGFDANSYRCLRADWSSTPVVPPDIAAERNADGTVGVWASWNGATAVRTWRVLGGDAVTTLQPLGDFPWTDFETAITVTTDSKVVAVAALDANGTLLASSASRPV